MGAIWERHGMCEFALRGPLLCTGKPLAYLQADYFSCQWVDKRPGHPQNKPSSQSHPRAQGKVITTGDTRLLWRTDLTHLAIRATKSINDAAHYFEIKFLHMGMGFAGGVSSSAATAGDTVQGAANKT
jgi:hypothetical protein